MAKRDQPAIVLKRLFVVLENFAVFVVWAGLFYVLEIADVLLVLLGAKVLQ